MHSLCSLNATALLTEASVQPTEALGSKVVMYILVHRYLILVFFCSQFFLTLDKAPRSWSVLYDALVHIRFVSTLHEKFRERINNLNGHLVTDIGTDKLAQVRRHNRSFDMKRNERSCKNGIKKLLRKSPNHGRGPN